MMMIFRKKEGYRCFIKGSILTEYGRYEYDEYDDYRKKKEE